MSRSSTAQHLWWIVVLTGLLVAPMLPFPAHDFVFDWLTARAVMDGLDPHSDLNDLAATYGLETSWDLTPHPRTPGALLIQLPLATLPLDWVAPSGRTIAVLAAIAAFMILRPRWWALPLAIPVIHSIYFGNMSIVVTLLLAIAFVRPSGFALGAAMALRLWPWFLIPTAWLVGRRDFARSAMFSFVCLNGLGLMLPGVSLQGTLRSLAAAAEAERVSLLNATSFIPIWVAVLFALLYCFVVHREPDLSRYAVPVALFLSPVVWFHYLTALAIPVSARAAHGRLQRIPDRSDHQSD